MSDHHPHHARPHHHHARRETPEAWEARLATFEHMADTLEPEMRRATEALLDAVGAASGVKLLDLACGLGHTTAAATERGADALGIDFTPAMLGAARRRFPNARFAIADMLDPPRGPWDAITCRLGAHHVHPAWLQHAFRVLAPGGRIAIAELPPVDAETWQNGMRPPEHWARTFEDAGLVDVRATPCEPRLGSVTADDPFLAGVRATGRGGPFRDGLLSIITGRKP